MNSVEGAGRAMAVQSPKDLAWPPATSAALPLRAAERPLLSSDRAEGPDDLDRAGAAAFLAEVVLHRRTDTPLCLGLFGAAGAGKSFFLGQTMAAVGEIAAAAARANGASPFVPDALVVRVEAREGREPAATLAGAVFDGLAVAYPDLAADLLHAGDDPVQVAREAGEALNEARRRLETERRTLEGLGGREARLVEDALETAGSRVDAYARGHRSPIDRALRRFGFVGGDPVVIYKDLVREAAESPGWAGQAGLALRSLWTYQGQGRLIVLGVVFALIAWALSALQDSQDAWLPALRGAGDRAGPLADWAQAHLSWLGSLQTAAVVAAALAVLLNLTRAARFLQPIGKGQTLLNHDLGERRRDLKGLLAHQTRRVDGLVAEVERASKRLGETERRADARRPGGRPAMALPGLAQLGPADARAGAFFRDLDAAMAAPGDPTALPPRALPRRIVVAIDGLDQCAAATAALFVEAARRLFGPGIVSIVAASRSHLAAGFSETDPAFAAAQIDRCLQLRFRLDGWGATEAARSAFASRLLEGTPASAQAPDAVDAQRSALDRPWRPREAETLAALAGLAGDTPRAVKHFLNVYRVARADPRLRDAPPPVFTALAMALALDGHGVPDDLAALERVTKGEASASPVLRRALALAREASGEPVELGQAQRGLEVAGRYTMHG